MRITEWAVHDCEDEPICTYRESDIAAAINHASDVGGRLLLYVYTFDTSELVEDFKDNDNGGE